MNAAWDHYRTMLAAPPTGDAEDAAGDRHAAVAMILVRGAAGPEVLLMVRADRPGDKWSGQVSLPGGHAEPVDENLCQTAIRETVEEVGVELEPDALVGRLARVRARARGRRVPMLITPYVFMLTDRPSVALGPEAADAFWLPLEHARAGQLDAKYRYRDGEIVRLLPSWKQDERTIWGLTLGMLQDLLDRTASAD